MNKLVEDSHICFVNLDQRKDRLERMVGVLKAAGITAQRKRAKTPEELVHIPNWRIKGMRDRPQKGAIGCYFSQLGIMEEAAKLKKHAWVMEDDLIFCEDFQDRLKMIENFLYGRDWDVFWFGGTFHVGPPWWHKEDLGRDAELTDQPRFVRTYGAFSTHAYIVNWQSLNKILPMLEVQLPRSIGIDYSFIQIQPQLHAYSFVPGCVIQYDNLSNIGHGTTYFSQFKKLGPYWYAPRMTDFDPLSFDWKEAALTKIK